MAVNDTRRLRVVVTGESTDAQEALEQVGEAADQTESKLVTLTRTLATWAGRGAIALGAVGTAAVTMGVSTASQLEQVEVGFTTMLGSAEKARKFMKQLQDFAAATPFEFTELVGSAQRFLAMGFAAKDIIPMLTAVGDAVAAMGGSADAVDSVTLALGQMQAKGKVSGEELMQLTERGIPALKILADSYGVSTSEMSKMIEKGQVLSDKAIPLLIKGLRDGTKNVQGFGGMMDKQSETMKGKWSTFMDNLRMGLGNLASKFLPNMKKGIELVSTATANFFAGLEGKGKLDGFSGTINDIGLGFRAFFAALKDGDITSDGLVGKFELMGAAIHGIINAFKTGEINSGGWRMVLEALAVTISKLVAGIQEVVGWLRSFAGFLRENEAAAWALWSTIGALVLVTKAHALAMGVQAAGGFAAMLKNLALVNTAMKVGAALQWAYNGAIAAGNWAYAVAMLDGYLIKQKLIAVWSKIVTAAQWLWNAAMTANPIGIVIVAIAALVGAIVLLWKNNEGFRNWVTNVLWPSLKKAWEQLKTVFLAVVNALIAAWNWLKDGTIAVWNAIWGFLRPIIQGIVAFFTPIFNVIAKVASVFWGFYTAVWKIVWIAIQVVIKLFIAYFQNIWWPTMQLVFKAIATAIQWLYNTIWVPIWNGIKRVVEGIVKWFTGTVVPSLKRAWQELQTALSFLKNIFVNEFNRIRDKIKAVFDWIRGPIVQLWRDSVAQFKRNLDVLKAGWDRVFNAVRDKASSIMDGVVKAFNKGRDGIRKAWDSVVEVTKKPINFVINEVYNNRIRTLWNKVAEKFGIKTRLDTIKGFAKGGVVGRGYGTKDDQLSLLMRGEGVLTTKEMRRLGGPRGFAEFRKSLAMYGNGGVVGGSRMGDGLGSWVKSLASKGKDIFQGLAGTAIKPLVSLVRSAINAGLPNEGFGGLMRGGAHTILDKMVAWVSGKDKEIGNLGGAGGAIGYRAMQALISRAFPGLGMISGFRPGSRTLSGNRSYHSMGRAVDYPPNRALALWIRNTFGSRTKELISPWNELNLHNGRPHRYTGAVWNQHNFPGGNAHVHWAMDSASVVQPGWFAGYNGTGKPETLINPERVDMGGGITINGGLHLHGVQDVKSLRNELLKLANRNGGRAGLPNK